MNREIGAQLQITSTFGQQAGKALGDYADAKAKDLRAQGKEEEARTWDEGGTARSAAHVLIGGLTGGIGGALGAGVGALSAEAINQAVAGLPAGLREAVGGSIAVGIGALAGGGAGAATAFNSDLNNRQLHPAEITLANELAARSGGKYTAEQIREQMRLMGNSSFGELPDTLAVLTNPDAIQNNIRQDPGMPRLIDRSVIVEVAGPANMEIQNYITNGTKEGAGYIPGASPYLPSSPAPVGKSPYSPLPSVATVKCANGDVACISGVGVQLSPVMSPDQKIAAGEYFGNLSFQYQRAASLALMADAIPLASAYSVASVLSGLLEQAFRPSAGQVIIDAILLDNIAEIAAKRTGPPLFMINEVMASYIKPKFSMVKDTIDSAAKEKK